MTLCQEIMSRFRDLQAIWIYSVSVGPFHQSSQKLRDFKVKSSFWPLFRKIFNFSKKKYIFFFVLHEIPHMMICIRALCGHFDKQPRAEAPIPLSHPCETILIYLSGNGPITTQINIDMQIFVTLWYRISHLKFKIRF